MHPIDNDREDGVNRLAGAEQPEPGTTGEVPPEVLLRQINELTRQNNELTGLVNELTGRVNELTGHNNQLTGAINALTGKLAEAVAQVHAGAARIREIANDRDHALSRLGDAVGTPASLEPRRHLDRRSTFLIVSNQRSGSTWLLTMLGTLADVATDFEVKWQIDYEPSVLHRVLGEETTTDIGDVLDELAPDAPVAGTKLVFDPTPYSLRQLQAIPSKFGPDLRIVHLVRDYRDVFLSGRRGAFHLLREDRAASVGKHLRNELERHELRADSSAAQAVDIISAYSELCGYLMNDLATSTFAAGWPYLRVDYRDIPSRWAGIVEFVGSTANGVERDHAFSEAPTRKLPDLDAGRLVSNLDELEPLFARFESLRAQLLPTTTRRNALWRRWLPGGASIA